VLGDVVISKAVVQYDFGRRLPDRFVRKDTLMESLGRPPQELRRLLGKLAGQECRRQLHDKIKAYLQVLQREPQLEARYLGAARDRLLEPTYHHKHQDLPCDNCDPLRLVPRRRLEAPLGAVHVPKVQFGLISSGDTVMKTGEDRDRIAKEEQVIAFEMEGAGVWDTFPCVVIKGVCDYADSHKNKNWQRYAAATAAACTKAFLHYWVSPEGAWY